jgi:hypothetical protein
MVSMSYHQGSLHGALQHFPHRQSLAKMIPAFLEDGYLPAGLHVAGEVDVIVRFGSATLKRRLLALRLMRWIELGRQVGAKRLFVDGSFVTAKPDPQDLDAVVWLNIDFAARVERGEMAAVELNMMLTTRQPEEIFAAEDRRDWEEWLEFFGRTREADRRRKGLVEVQL